MESHSCDPINQVFVNWCAVKFFLLLLLSFCQKRDNYSQLISNFNHVTQKQEFWDVVCKKLFLVLGVPQIFLLMCSVQPTKRGLETLY